MASGELIQRPEEQEKCGDCGQVVTVREKVIECEISERWFHVTCEGVAEDTYKCLKKNQGVHWYCKVCESGVAKIIKSVQALQQRLHKIEEKQVKLDAELGGTKQQVKELKEVFETKMKEYVTTESGKRLEETKKLLDEGIREMKDQLQHGDIHEGSSKDAVSKKLKSVLW
jgi:Na+-transporting NADH:ubiquinone oxidoreductase subunit NqrC